MGKPRHDQENQYPVDSAIPFTLQLYRTEITIERRLKIGLITIHVLPGRSRVKSNNKSLVVESHDSRNHTGRRDGDFCEKWPNAAGKSKLDRQNCENLLYVVKIIHFGRSGKKFW